MCWRILCFLLNLLVNIASNKIFISVFRGERRAVTCHFAPASFFFPSPFLFFLLPFLRPSSSGSTHGRGVCALLACPPTPPRALPPGLPAVRCCLARAHRGDATCALAPRALVEQPVGPLPGRADHGAAPSPCSMGTASLVAYSPAWEWRRSASHSTISTAPSPPPSRGSHRSHSKGTPDSHYGPLVPPAVFAARRWWCPSVGWGDNKKRNLSGTVDTWRRRDRQRRHRPPAGWPRWRCRGTWLVVTSPCPLRTSARWPGARPAGVHAEARPGGEMKMDGGRMKCQGQNWQFAALLSSKAKNEYFFRRGVH